MTYPRQNSRLPSNNDKGITRRRFLSSIAETATASAGVIALAGCASGRGKPLSDVTPARRKRVALIATEVRKLSHAQHFVDRFLEGYGWQGEHHHPPMDLVSLYVDQFPQGDLAHDRSQRHGVPIYPTVAEALTCGSSKLAVDAVVIIGEHGMYPRNEKGQTLYPRYRFFKSVVNVFESSGRAVPVFNDKHLSTDWDHCVEMVADSRRLGFPFLAGSSLPVTWRIPSIEMPLDIPLAESACVCYGGVDSYDFHGLETAQCMSERRAGGEVGVKSVHALTREHAIEMLEKREATRDLVLAALARSHSCSPRTGYSYPVPDMPWLREHAAGITAYFIEHLDGFRTTMVLLNGAIQDFNYAGRVRDTGQIISCQMHLPMPPRMTTLADFFNPLVNNIERMILEGRAPYPVERTLLTSGMTLFAVESLYRKETLVETPQLKVAYRAPVESTFWRA
jgi:hypothetical protein